MTFYVATVGNDPAPVALGYLTACQHGTITEARLFLDKPRGPSEGLRQQALLRWLEGRGLLVKTDQPLTTTEEEAGTIFNLTGGQKPSVLPLLQRAQATGSTAFVVDAHGQELLIHDLLAATSEPAKQHLTVQDYLQLYLPSEMQQQLLMRVHGIKGLPSPLASALQLEKNAGAAECWVKPPAHPIYPGRTAWGSSHIVMWWVVRRSQLSLIWDIRQLPGEKLRERLRWLSKKTRDLGGQLATPVFWMSEVSSEVLEWIDEDLHGQVILADGRHNLRDWSAELSNALNTSPEQSELELQKSDSETQVEATNDEPGNVYVALLGGQPIPPLVGLQSQQNVSQVYLLCTPQVQSTGQRLKTVLEARPEWQQRVHILPVEAAQPVSIRQRLDQIHQQHPDARVSINLSGGTKALALHAELWAQDLPFAQTEYTLGHQVSRLNQQFTAQWHLGLQEELALRGVKVSQVRPLPPVIPELIRTAAQCFEGGTQDKVAIEAFATALQTHLPELLPPGGHYFSLPGLAGEYLGITALEQALKGAGVREMVWATRLNFASGSEREIDGLAILNDGRLLILEVKRDLLKGIEAESENDQTPALGERLAGLYAHSLLVGRLKAGRTSERWEKAVRQSGPLSSPFSLWVIGSGKRALPQGVHRFPEELTAFLN